tara:strand:- start:1344 stop:1952 length:609 start_codon:yes stop_codon:yes gene_type:complete
MFEVILLVIGVITGFCLYKKLIMSDSKQKSINNKILSTISDHSDTDSSNLASRIRENINSSYLLEWQDIKSCFIDYFCSNVKTNEDSSQNISSKEEYKDDEIESFLKSKFEFLKDWDIRSLSKKNTSVTEEPLAENQQNKEESTTPKEAEVDSKPEDSASPSSESKPQIEPKTKTEDEPKKEKKATTNKSKKEKTSDKKNDS